MDLHGAFHVYDTTLRDGAQQEGLNLSVADKLTIARQLDGLGVGYIEGGWPGANPKDTEFFRRATVELDLKHAKLAAFGSTRRAGIAAADDPQVAALRDSGASVVTLVAKSHDRHVDLALRTTLEENLAMVRDTVSHLRAEGQQVFLDAEHFFDGYRANRDYALEVLRTAYEAGADVVALCDTNGGMLPDWVSDVVRDVIDTTGVRVGIHAHNDSGCAVANSLAAIEAGASHVQGCINGYGERTGNADLVTVVANLELKLDRSGAPARPARGVDPDRARRRRGHQRAAGLPAALRRRLGVRPQGRAARQRDQGRPRPLPAHRPGAGRQRHAAARLRHGRPRLDRAQGPRARLRPRLRQGAAHPGHRRGSRSSRRPATPSRPPTRRSSCCSARWSPGHRPSYFEVESWRVITETLDHREVGEEAVSEATVKLTAQGERHVVTGEGNGPVNALDQALRKAIGQAFPEVVKFELIDYKVRILDQGHGTDAITRVLIETSDGESSWVTVGVGHNVIEASWGALVDGLTFGLRRQGA